MLPFETIRDGILGQDQEIFYNGKLRRHAIWYVQHAGHTCMLIEPLLQREHITFLKGLAGKRQQHPIGGAGGRACV